ncbi:methyltransferase [Schizothecium vesticola]|uniref:Methyltransferase n=1 Tax=Schizothecium vesticola TaxID=314040 RepID=A0AA40FBL9_9PEZI|nr:methyltransferase [Schizothecium vesticola]
MDYDTLLDAAIDSGYLPSSLIRLGARQMTRGRLRDIIAPTLEEQQARKQAFVDALRGMSIAIEQDKANEQHYEVGVGVLAACLGPRMKYSSALWSRGAETIAEAEDAMLEMYLERGEMEDGMRVLDLGCGWGSGTIYLAEKMPNSEIVGFSNSKRQKAYILAEAERRGLKNVNVITGDAATFEFERESFDRVMSIEMFEHMKNYEALLAKVARALRPGGKMFMHVFGHREMPYHFEEGWMSRYFFTGGTMPSRDLFLYFQDDLKIQKQWWVSGTNYQKTLEAWLKNWAANKTEVRQHLAETYGEGNVDRWYNRWKAYYMGSSEFFGWKGGNEFGLIHYLWEKPVRAV